MSFLQGTSDKLMFIVVHTSAYSSCDGVHEFFYVDPNIKNSDPFLVFKGS